MRRVERGERLVEQDDLGLDGQGASQGDPLLLASGQLVRVAAAVARQAHELEQLVDPCPFGSGPRPRPKPTLRPTLRCGNSAPSWGT